MTRPCAFTKQACAHAPGLREVAELASDLELLAIADLIEVPVPFGHLRGLDPQTRITHQDRAPLRGRRRRAGGRRQGAPTHSDDHSRVDHAFGGLRLCPCFRGGREPVGVQATADAVIKCVAEHGPLGVIRYPAQDVGNLLWWIVLPPECPAIQRLSDLLVG